MAKKVKTGQIVTLVAALLGIVAIFMMLAPGLAFEAKIGNGKDTISGFKLMFGSEDGHKFNVMMFLAFVFVLVGIAGVVLSFLLKGKIGSFLAIGGFLLAGIFFFLFRSVYYMGVEEGKDAVELMEKMMDIKLGVGAIMAGIFSLLAAVASALSAFVIKD